MTGLDLCQFKAEIVAPTLDAIGLGGTAAINLLTGTALVESGLASLRQYGGPALGLWQMEPVTHDDIWATFLADARLASLRGLVLKMLGRDLPRCGQLVPNLRYACAMARIKYYRAPDPLPAASDAAAMCRMWKRVYNSNLGAGAADGPHITLFQQAIGA